jgi:hypothetical protein
MNKLQLIFICSGKNLIDFMIKLKSGEIADLRSWSLHIWSENIEEYKSNDIFKLISENMSKTLHFSINKHFLERKTGIFSHDSFLITIFQQSWKFLPENLEKIIVQLDIPFRNISGFEEKVKQGIQDFFSNLVIDFAFSHQIVDEIGFFPDIFDDQKAFLFFNFWQQKHSIIVLGENFLPEKYNTILQNKSSIFELNILKNKNLWISDTFGISDYQKIILPPNLAPVEIEMVYRELKKITDELQRLHENKLAEIFDN